MGIILKAAADFTTAYFLFTNFCNQTSYKWLVYMDQRGEIL